MHININSITLEVYSAVIFYGNNVKNKAYSFPFSSQQGFIIVGGVISLDSAKNGGSSKTYTNQLGLIQSFELDYRRTG